MKYTILTNDTLNFTYDEVCDYAVNYLEEEAPIKDSSRYFEICQMMADENFECDLENIKDCKEYNVPCVIEGGFSGWRYAELYGSGLHSIIPERHESVYDIIMKILRFNGFYNIEVVFEDGIINVIQNHHDGTNYYTIKALSAKGKKKVNAEYKSYDFKKLPYLYGI